MRQHTGDQAMSTSGYQLDKLSEIERETLETARENIAAMKAVVYPTFEQEVERIWIIEMAQLGHSADDARKILRSRMIQTNMTAPHLTAPNEIEKPPTSKRERLRNRRRSENFTFDLDGLKFTATISRYADGRVAELFLNNHKGGNQADTNARDSAIVLSFALQHGGDIDEIRKALCRDSKGRALSPLGAALDIIAEQRGVPDD
jgi:ribonucleoside-diphosphate reductase alpha chain